MQQKTVTKFLKIPCEIFFKATTVQMHHPLRLHHWVCKVDHVTLGTTAQQARHRRLSVTQGRTARHLSFLLQQETALQVMLSA